MNIINTALEFLGLLLRALPWIQKLGLKNRKPNHHLPRTGLQYSTYRGE
jgi:hypothetical protein